MRSEAEVKAMLVDVAQSDKRVRAVVLQGSRAYIDAPRDEWMDYDVVYVLDDLKSLKAMTKNLAWMDVFGEPAVRQTADDQPDWGDPNAFICMTQYTDGVRIDLCFNLVETMLNEFKSGDHDPSIIWLDKDGAFADYLEPPDQAPCFEPGRVVKPDSAVEGAYTQAGHRWLVEPPSKRDFHVCCNEFWWLAPYVAKGLCRLEMPFVQKLFALQRDELLKMLSWQAGISTDFKVSVGKCGKYLEKYLPPALWQGLRATYADGQYPSVWQALFAACKTFRSAAVEVADRFGYSYPYQDDERVTTLLKAMQLTAADRQRKITCAFTGRRPQALPWNYDDGHPEARAFAKRLRKLIELSYNEGYRNFICGMAQGVDLLACEQAILLKQTTCPELTLVAAIPGKDQTRGWPTEQIERYHNCLKHCDVKRLLSQYCNPETYHHRNRWMVDHAGRLIAVWEGDPSGGTGRTVAYAQSRGCEVLQIWPE